MILLIACESNQPRVDELETKAKAQAEQATSALAEGANKAKQAAKDAAPDLQGAARSWLTTEGDELPWLKQGVTFVEAGAGIASIVDEVVDKDATVQPIFKEVPKGETGELDQAIADMPKVEVVDGVTIGFRQVDDLSVDKKSSDRAYLVLWRKEDRLYGFFYRSEETIHIDKLIELAPKIIPLVEKAALAD